MISVLLPTTGRPEMAEACVRGLIETTEGYDVELVAAVDADLDTERRLAAIEYPDRFRYRLSPRSFYRGCSRAWNDALGFSTGDPIVFAADDLTFHPGWLPEALDHLARFPDGWGLVGFNDGHLNGAELATHYLMSRRFVVEVLGGVVAWDFYQHSFNDLEVNVRAKQAGRFDWAPGARVTHQHWTFGDREQDSTDTRTLASHGSSEAIFNERKAAGFPNDGIEPVITE